MKLCEHVAADGKGCGVVVGKAQRLCLWHDPQRAEKAAAARRKGAERSRARQRSGGKRGVRVADPAELPGPLETLEDAARWSAWIVEATATGVIDGRTAHELAYSLRVFVDSRKHIDRTDERVRELTRKLAELRAAAERAS